MCEAAVAAFAKAGDGGRRPLGRPELFCTKVASLACFRGMLSFWTDADHYAEPDDHSVLTIVWHVRLELRNVVANYPFDTGSEKSPAW
jgi:hypothetical protein